MNAIIQTVVIYAVPLVLAVTLHEAAHAYAARLLGDDTAFRAGRMSVNPLRHIDRFGTLVLPVLVYFSSSLLVALFGAYLAAPFVFGYAKPVPVDFDKLNHPRRDMFWVALAGPAANLLMAALWMGAGFWLVPRLGGSVMAVLIVEAGVMINVLMFVFNLFPMPPLDGGHIVTSLLPKRYALKFARIDRFGFFIVLALLLFHLLDGWFVQGQFLIRSLLTSLLYSIQSLIN